jgi:hypothetical protein
MLGVSRAAHQYQPAAKTPGRYRPSTRLSLPAAAGGHTQLDRRTAVWRACAGAAAAFVAAAVVPKAALARTMPETAVALGTPRGRLEDLLAIGRLQHDLNSLGPRVRRPQLPEAHALLSTAPFDDSVKLARLFDLYSEDVATKTKVSIYSLFIYLFCLTVQLELIFATWQLMNMNAGVVYYAEVSMMKPARDKLSLEDQGPTRQSEQ